MLCPTCQTPLRIVSAAARCPFCGAAVDPSAPHADDPANTIATAPIVEGFIRADHVAHSDDIARDPAPDGISTQVQPAIQAERALTVVPTVERRLITLERAAALPALAWRQPVVRAAVRTGASALALSLAARAARHWLAGSRRGRSSTRALVPLADALRRQMANDRAEEREAVVSETYIYVRRVVRR